MTTINLAYNGLSIPGAVAMAEALEENDILTDLDLTCNRIFDEGAVRIGKALLVNETLSKLKVWTLEMSLYIPANSKLKNFEDMMEAISI